MNRANRALRILEKWRAASEKYLFYPHARHDLLCYGVGTADGWAMQTHCTAAAAYAVMATASDYDPAQAGISRNEALDRALNMFRYAALSSKGGDMHCVDGRQWLRPLALQRMAHGIHRLWPHLTGKDRELLLRMLTAQCDVICEQPVHAGLEKNNSPESNGWNGCLLMQTLLFFPDHPRAAVYREKATAYWLNSISVPADAANSALINGRPLAEWHVGANFRDTMALCHHGYLNLGYMVICLSNAAMAHFAFRAYEQPPPMEIYHHVAELWRFVKLCTFPDGRLMRVGGDTRARYCYCQEYALPSWRMLADKYGDQDCAVFRERWLDIVAYEQDLNGDGSFFSKRLAAIAENSPFYYTRLEGDRAGALSMEVCWQTPASAAVLPENKNDAPAAGAWVDHDVGAAVSLGKQRVASWSWKRLPVGLFLPSGRSDMAEWHCNLFGELRGMGIMECYEKISAMVNLVPGGGLIACGAMKQGTELPWGEGEANTFILQRGNAFFALPDDQTAVVLQYAKPLMPAFLRGIKGLFLSMPNDIFNRQKRVYRSAEGELTLGGVPGQKEDIVVNSEWLTIDGLMGLRAVYGGGGFCIHRPAARQVEVRRHPPLTSLYADEICMAYRPGPLRVETGQTILDIGAALFVEGGNQPAAARHARRIICPDAPAVRAVMLDDAGGRTWLAAANFSAEPCRPALLVSGAVAAKDHVSGRTYAVAGERIAPALEPWAAVLLSIVAG